MPDTPTPKEPDFKPEHVDPKEIAPKAKAGISAMGDAFRRAMAGGEGGIPAEPLPEAPASRTGDDKLPAATPAPPPTPTPPAAPQKAATHMAGKSIWSDAAKPAAHEEKPASTDIPSENFKRLDLKVAKYEARVAELEAKLLAAEEGTKKYADIERQLAELQKKNQELSWYEKRATVETAPEFEAAFDRPIKAAIQDAVEAVPPTIKDRLEGVLNAKSGKWRDDQMRAIVSELEDDFSKTMLFTAYKTLRDKQRERDEELSKQRVELSYDKLVERRKAEQAQVAEHARQVREGFWGKVGPEVEGELKEAGDEEYSKTVVRKLRGLMDGSIDADGFAEVLKTAARGFRVSKTEAPMKAELETLREQVKALSASKPTVSVTSRQPQAPAKSMGDKFRDFLKGGGQQQ